MNWVDQRTSYVPWSLAGPCCYPVFCMVRSGDSVGVKSIRNVSAAAAKLWTLETLLLKSQDIFGLWTEVCLSEAFSVKIREGIHLRGPAWGTNWTKISPVYWCVSAYCLYILFIIRPLQAIENAWIKEMSETSLSTNQNLVLIAVDSWRSMRSVCLNELLLPQWHENCPVRTGVLSAASAVWIFLPDPAFVLDSFRLQSKHFCFHTRWHNLQGALGILWLCAT